MKKKIQIGVVGMAIFVAGVAVGQAPEQDIGRRFPNLMAAQQYCRQAFDAISAAQQANDNNLAGMHSGQRFARPGESRAKSGGRICKTHSPLAA
jgi:hypothetical protein